jgi:mono/diheme cytochrome c family protein
MTRHAILHLALAAFAAAEPRSWDPGHEIAPLSPQAALETIEVPPGYRLQCVASEPMVEDPASFAFDPDGALYVCEWRSYMQDEFGSDQLAPVSRVVKLVDTDGDGVMDRRSVFIDGVVLPRTVLPMGDRVLVNFTGDTSYYAYHDDNHDGVADRRAVVFQGVPDPGNIEHQRSGILWNLDNRIYTNDRYFELRDDGRLTAHKYRAGRFSQWGLARDDDGRLVGTWAGGANPAHSFQLPAGYPILRHREHGPGYGVPHSICKVRDESSGGYDFEKQRVLTQFSACCGQTVLRSHLMPEFHGHVVTCEPVGRLVRLSRIEWRDGLGTAHNAFPGREFIRSSDPYFRPVWSETGPDGCLYLADMYRGIVQEKAWFPTDPKDPRKAWYERYLRVKKWGMQKVVRHGRIYRLIPKDQPPGKPPRMLGETPEQRVAHLAHPNGWWRDTAQLLLVSRRERAALPALLAMAGGHADPRARVHALWTLDGLASLPRELLVAALAHPSPQVRRAAVQIGEPLLVAGDPEIARAFAALASDPDPQVLAQLHLAHRAAGKGIPEPLAARASGQPLLAALAAQDRDFAAQPVRLSAAAKPGEEIYQNLCATCHGHDGRGVLLDGKPMAPSLANSEWFGSPTQVGTLARIVLHGQTGPIDGVSYGEGLMPPLADAYTDEQIAAVLNYVGERWHGWKMPVAAKTIGEVRAQTAKRKVPWTIEELRARMK